MSPDIDELLRTSMRRHADDAPTSIDLDAVRTRSRAITRRRRYEAVAAVVTTLVVLLGLGYAASQLRSETAPITPVPGGSAWTAFLRFDQNAAPSGRSDVIVAVNGTETTVGTATRSGQAIGWYGVDHRTLVWSVGSDSSTSSAIWSATLNADGSIAAAAAPLRIPVGGELTGIAFPLDDGFAVWSQDGGSAQSGSLEIVNETLTDAVEQPLPAGQPLFVNGTTVGLTDPGTGRTTLVSRADGTTGTVTVCLPPLKVALAADDIHVAIACGDGTVDILNLSSRSVFQTPTVPGAAQPAGELLGIWYDPALGLHVSMTPEAQANYTDVRDFGWNGSGWSSEGGGVLTRVFPADSSSLRLERLAKDGVDSYNAGRWIAERPHDVDLGTSTGSIAVRPVDSTTPTPTPSASTQVLPPAPATAPWVAWLTPVAGAAPSAVDVTVTAAGRSTRVSREADAQVAIAGWTGPGRRTLVWGATQDYAGDQVIETATFAADGSLESGPTRLTAPDGTEMVGRPFVLSDGRLAVWRFGETDGQPQGTLYRFSADLTSPTTQDLPVGDAVFVTPDAIGLQDPARAPSTLKIVGTDGTGSVELPSCRTGFAASVDPLGTFAAVSCGGTEVDVVAVPTAASGDAGAVTPLMPFPLAAGVLATWFDAESNVHASSREPGGAVSSWTWDAGRGTRGDWVLSATQGVATASYVDGYAVQLVATGPRGAYAIEGRWTTGTDPSLDLTPTTAFATLEGGAAARPTQSP